MNAEAVHADQIPISSSGLRGAPRLTRQFAIRFIAALTLASGLLNIYSVVGPSLPDRVEMLRRFLPLEFVHYARSLVLFSGFALVLLSVNIWKRKRRAWMAVSALSCGSVVLHLTKGIDYEEALVSAGVLAALWLLRGSFTVRSREIQWRTAVFRMITVALLATAYGVLGFWLLEPADLGRDFNWKQSVRHTIQALALDEDGLRAHTAYGRWFLESLDLLAFGSVLYAGWTVFRPVVYRFRTHPSQAREARAIVEQHGRTAQDFFKYSLDKSFFFSQDRSAFVAYRVGASCALALGDPVGPAATLEPLVREFVRYCRDNGWRVAFHQATYDCLPIYERAGLRRLKIGDDAVVKLDQFTVSGKAGKPLRTKLNQFEKLGIRAALYAPPVPEEVLDQAQSVSDEWLQIPGRRERQFTLGRFDREYLRETEILAAEDSSGCMLGFLNLIPSYRRGEATLDLMRRRASGPNGIMDYLFIQAFLVARERGYERFNLGMSPMSGFLPHEESSAEERAIHAFFQRLNFLFSFQGLRAYKAKFATEWEPRYIVYSSALDLPVLPLALGRVSQMPEEE